MIIETIALKGFLSFVDETVDFRNSKIMLISGKNGEGKSALLESIPFCFWGIGRGKTIADFINDDCDTLRIEIVFIMESVRYKKIRQLGRAGNINELYVATSSKKGKIKWKLMSDDTKKKTDKLLSSILGYDYEVFANSVFFSQKESSVFIDGTASKRKELLCNLLGIELYEDAEYIAKKKAQDINSVIQTKSIVIQDKQRIIENKDQIIELYKKTKNRSKDLRIEIKELRLTIKECLEEREEIKINSASQNENKKRLEELNKQLLQLSNTERQISLDLDAVKEDIESVINEGTEQIEAINDIIAAEEGLLEEKNKLNDIIFQCESKKSKLPDLRKKISNQRESKEMLLSKQSELQTNIKILVDKQEKIKKSNAICPITDEECDKLTDDNKEIMIEDIQKDIDKLNKKLSKIIQDFDRSRELILELDQKIETISKYSDKASKATRKLVEIERDLKEVESSKEDLPKVKIKYRKKFDKLEVSKEDYEQRYDDIVKEIKQVNKNVVKLEKKVVRDYASELEKINKKIDVYSDDLDVLNDENEILIKKFGQYEREIEQIKIAEDDIKIIQNEIDLLREDLRIYTELSLSFGQNGIQKEIIVSNVPILEEKTNELVTKFTKNNMFNVKFDLDPTTKSGKLKKRGGLDIVIYQNGKKPRELNMYSGGESVRIVFAFLLSLSYLLTKRAGKRSQTLIIDERVAALDSEGINQFIEIVKYISAQYKKILIVSHISELKESFPNGILLVQKHGTEGSKVYNVG